MTRPARFAAPLLAAPLLAAAVLAAGCSAASSGSKGPSGATGAGTTASPAAPAALATLVTQSHSEHGLIIYGNAPTQVIQPLLDAFSKAYPWIKPQYSQLADNQVFTKYQSEHAQSATTADLLIADSIPQFLTGDSNGLFANITPAGLENFPSFMNQGHGVYVLSPEPITFTYNAKSLAGAQVPTTYAQLAADVQADPAKYPLTSYSPANPLGYAAVYGLIHQLGQTAVYSYLDTLSKHTKTFDEGLDGLNYLVQGGASVGWLGSGLAQSVVPQYKGLLKYSFMADATPLVPRLTAVTDGAADSASAQLFLDFAYSQPGQQVMCAVGLEAAINDFKAASGCTADLTDLATKVPTDKQYLVPVSQDVVNQQQAITARWNQAAGH